MGCCKERSICARSAFKYVSGRNSGVRSGLLFRTALSDASEGNAVIPIGREPIQNLRVITGIKLTHLARQTFSSSGDDLSGIPVDQGE